jgi:hypothetical protein
MKFKMGLLTANFRIPDEKTKFWDITWNFGRNAAGRELKLPYHALHLLLV